ncbi:MAG: hypothetical protein HY254_11940 [Burkholderiales bacterium]|nr:hypothetical protein [Burkholderiales bacterium]
MRLVLLTLTLVLLTPTLAFAGRPVFNDLSLPELVSRSQAVLVVDRPATFAPQNSANANACNVISWPLIARELLYSGTDASRLDSPDITSKLPDSPVKNGDKLVVTINPVSLVDCGFRSRPNLRNGVSFAAERYASSLNIENEPPKTFIVFLRWIDGRWSLTAASAIEDISKLKDVRKSFVTGVSVSNKSAFFSSHGTFTYT